MIDSISLENFKCFGHLYMPLKPLTLIAGINGAGKSSIIQALLLLRQSFKDKDTDWSEHVLINGSLVELDKAEDLLFADAQGDNPEVRIEIESNNEVWTFSITPETIDDRASVSVHGNLHEAKQKLSLLQDDFVYLYADRLQPRAKYQARAKALQDSRLGDKSADNAVFRFAKAINSNEQISISSLRHPDAKDDSVFRNTTAWINYIMGCNMDVKAEETEKDKEAKYIYSISNKDGEQKTLSPLNVPFGSNYLLPIVLAVLTAPSGSMILIENPESHLHPKAQGRVGELLARCAQSGVQIIVETHSDHLMNGIRYACHEGWISNDKLEMDLIGIDNDGLTHIRRHIDINNEGYVENWIPGFFDEWEDALKRLLPE